MNFATFDLNLLRVLDAVLREGSTVKAAERLGLSQPAVSNALSRLRHALGDELFVRHGNRLVPTDYAASIREGLGEEFNRLEHLLTPPESFDPALASGRFKIAASDFFAELLMPALGDRLNRTAPNVRAQLVELVPDDYVRSVEQYGADLALIPDTDLPAWINRKALFRSSFVVIARATNPRIAGVPQGAELPIDRFCAMSHVLFSPEGKFAAMGDSALARVGRQRQVAMTLPVFSGVCRVVSESDLIALVPEQLANRLASGLGLKIFRPPFEIVPARIVAIWHRRSDANPMASWVRDQIFDLLKPLDTMAAP
ncbi:LysR family transcriptional regulator [Aliiruegeria lutimaris]|uniref:DNA-binding transcriptional regulator, LysR family n=1 Tax=Aliiruegeria lutimaris TaxID=571298 RepID=A0A1G9CTC7_9RHOB|nr:LysR family transcriptional regulator [Aliiruegeria lutimaris]SDK54878.1 DNA-binding transcriptional regulator, LysR family [Aliiruegeria lutimaris]